MNSKYSLHLQTNGQRILYVNRMPSDSSHHTSRHRTESNGRYANNIKIFLIPLVCVKVKKSAPQSHDWSGVSAHIQYTPTLIRMRLNKVRSHSPRRLIPPTAVVRLDTKNLSCPSNTSHCSPAIQATRPNLRPSFPRGHVGFIFLQLNGDR